MKDPPETLEDLLAAVSSSPPRQPRTPRPVATATAKPQRPAPAEPPQAEPTQRRREKRPREPSAATLEAREAKRNAVEARRRVRQLNQTSRRDAGAMYSELTILMDAALENYAGVRELREALDGLPVAHEWVPAGPSEAVDSVDRPPALLVRRRVENEYDWTLRLQLPLPAAQAYDAFERVALLFLRAPDLVALASRPARLGRDRWMARQKQRFPGMALFVLVDGLENYFRQRRTRENRVWTASIRALLPEDHPDQPAVPRSEAADGNVPGAALADQAAVERHVAWLMLQPSTFVLVARSAADRLELVLSVLREVALLPFHRGAVGAGATGDATAVRCGQGAQDTYVRMLGLLPVVSGAAADATAGAFPSLRRLWEALAFEGSSARLAAVTIPGASRAIGARTAERIRSVFTGRNPDALPA